LALIRLRDATVTSRLRNGSFVSPLRAFNLQAELEVAITALARAPWFLQVYSAFVPSRLGLGCCIRSRSTTLSSVPINRNNEITGLAERRAADVSAGRHQLGSGREVLDRYRANELAEAEALALARIKADTQRALAHQAQTLRDVERAAELVAIERRAADLDVIKEVRRRQTLDREATIAATSRAEANRLAEQTTLDRKTALIAAQEARQARLKAEREALRAQRSNRRTRISLMWVALRNRSPIAVGLAALLLGFGANWLLVKLNSNAQITEITAVAAEIMSTDKVKTEAPLRLDTELSASLARQ
jgi:hypothetical protein